MCMSAKLQSIALCVVDLTSYTANLRESSPSEGVRVSEGGVMSEPCGGSCLLWYMVGFTGKKKALAKELNIPDDNG